MGYVIQRKSYDKTSTNLNIKGTGFVCCLVDAGSNCGIINKNIFSIDEKKVMPSLIMFGPSYYTKQVYNNYKKETTRIHQLAQTLEGKKIVKPTQLEKFKNTISNLKEYRDSLSEPQVEDVSMGKDNGKRLSLNNGIFKPESVNF